MIMLYVAVHESASGTTRTYPNVRTMSAHDAVDGSSTGTQVPGQRSPMAVT
jgi:hypothetical protein